MPKDVASTSSDGSCCGARSGRTTTEPRAVVDDRRGATRIAPEVPASRWRRRRSDRQLLRSSRSRSAAGYAVRTSSASYSTDAAGAATSRQRRPARWTTSSAEYNGRSSRVDHPRASDHGARPERRPSGPPRPAWRAGRPRGPGPGTRARHRRRSGRPAPGWRPAPLGGAGQRPARAAAGSIHASTIRCTPGVSAGTALVPAWASTPTTCDVGTRRPRTHRATKIWHPLRVTVGRRRRAWMSWSSGKDSAMALHVARTERELDVRRCSSPMNADADRVAMHAVRRELLDAQAARLGASAPRRRHPVAVPERRVRGRDDAAIATCRATTGVEQMVFGDLFLEDIRDYREDPLRRHRDHPGVPAVGATDRPLARDMLAAGVRAVLTCVDPRCCPPEFAGRAFDEALLAELPRRRRSVRRAGRVPHVRVGRARVRGRRSTSRSARSSSATGSCSATSAYGDGRPLRWSAPSEHGSAALEGAGMDVTRWTRTRRPSTTSR